MLSACAGTPEKQEKGIYLWTEEERNRLDVEREKMEQRGPQDVQRVQHFFESMPRCESQDVAAAVAIGRVTPVPEGGELRVRGFLTPSPFACNLASCFDGAHKGPSRCCNQCHGSWFMTVPGALASDAVLLDETSPAAPMKDWELLDCAVADIRTSLALPEVIARGTVVRKVAPSPPKEASDLQAFWRMNVTHLCVMESPSARVFTKDMVPQWPYWWR